MNEELNQAIARAEAAEAEVRELRAEVERLQAVQVKLRRALRHYVDLLSFRTDDLGNGGYIVACRMLDALNHYAEESALSVDRKEPVEPARAVPAVPPGRDQGAAAPTRGQNEAYRNVNPT